MTCLTFSRKPNISDMTPENRERTTTRVILDNNGLIINPDILKGLSSSYKTKRKWKKSEKWDWRLKKGS